MDKIFMLTKYILVTERKSFSWVNALIVDKNIWKQIEWNKAYGIQPRRLKLMIQFQYIQEFKSENISKYQKLKQTLISIKSRCSDYIRIRHRNHKLTSQKQMWEYLDLLWPIRKLIRVTQNYWIVKCILYHTKTKGKSCF